MTVGECRAAMRPPVPSDLDPRSRLRKAFVQNLTELEAEAVSSLGNLIDVSNDTQDLIKKLARKAATVWLEFAAHRCRIIIEFKGLAKLSMEQKVAIAEDSALNLVVTPALGRYGNAQGTDLDCYKIVDRCSGELVTIQKQTAPSETML